MDLQKSVALPYNISEYAEKAYRKILPFIIASKYNKIPRNKLNKACERPLQAKL
jgi:hypothetical protein